MSPDPVLVCRSLGGVATTEQLIAAGVSRRAIEAELRPDRLERSRRGVYVLRALPEPVRHALRHGAGSPATACWPPRASG